MSKVVCYYWLIVIFVKNAPSRGVTEYRCNFYKVSSVSAMRSLLQRRLWGAKIKPELNNPAGLAPTGHDSMACIFYVSSSPR